MPTALPPSQLVAEVSTQGSEEAEPSGGEPGGAVVGSQPLPARAVQQQQRPAALGNSGINGGKRRQQVSLKSFLQAKSAATPAASPTGQQPGQGPAAGLAGGALPANGTLPAPACPSQQVPQLPRLPPQQHNGQGQQPSPQAQQAQRQQAPAAPDAAPGANGVSLTVERQAGAGVAQTNSAFVAAELAAAASSHQEQTAAAKDAWEKIQQRMQVPSCSHGEPAALKQVNKSGPNKGKLLLLRLCTPCMAPACD